MDLVEYLAAKFKKKLREVFEEEERTASFLPQEDFPNCKARARKGVEIAAEPVIDDFALAIAIHEAGSHAETEEERAVFLDEQKSLVDEGADIQAVSKLVWWNDGP